MNARVEKLIKKLEELELDAILIGSSANRRYLSHFAGSNAMLYLSARKQILVTDFRYLEQAALECPDFEIRDQGQIGLLKTALQSAQEDGVKYIGFESDHTCYSTFQKLSEYSGFVFKPTEKIVETFRQIKDNEELEKLRKAESIGDLAFSQIIPFIEAHYQTGLSEVDIALELERIMRKEGATATSFSSIVATGAKSSLCHAVPGEQTLQKGDFVVMDFGCIYKGYCSDMTRTLVIEEVSSKHEEIYACVLKAQYAALQGIKPGKTGKEVDTIARDIIKEAGYGDYFGHGLGHSVGLEIHETPRFSMLDETVIVPGMVLTVEPGIYVPGFGGVRIEDMIVVTEEGIENLTYSPKELIVIKKR